MIKKIIAVSVLGVSALGMMTANAAAPGIYVTGQLGYANTHMDRNINDIINPISDMFVIPVADKNLSNNGLAGRIALGYQFNQNFAVEAGYLQLGQKKYDLPLAQDLPLGTGTLKLQQNAIDFVGKGIIPLTDKINAYGKLGVAYLTTQVKSVIKVDGSPTLIVNLNDQAQVDQHKWAPEAAVGVSYDITPNVSLDTSWTHIQPFGKNKPGNVDFVAVGIGYSFG